MKDTGEDDFGRIPEVGLPTTTGEDDLIDQVASRPKWTQFCDRLAQDMFRDWQNNNANESFLCKRGLRENRYHHGLLMYLRKLAIFLLPNSKTTYVEPALKLKIPDCTLQGEPHISSNIHVWMKNYRSVALIKGTSGFGWSENQSDGSPGLRMGSISGTESESGNRAGKRVNGSKKKGDSPFEERFLDIMQSFSQNTKESLNGIACRLGFEHEVEKKRNVVFDSLSNMHFLSKEDKMVVTMRLCKNQHELSMFFSLSMEDKAIMGMDNMDVDSDGPYFFKAVQFRTLHTMVR
ncbi:sodium channel protein type 8 subunit alpha [Striga asiatica]|uniref:Sodium channel protein type 8 subunit alpha n=1 Tax=Striga asiatica TaxID=4170 RepID=A0A5A7QB72_STRAF|nr:sodium channel protein type 8 subunit alpha [Striga asiatica]